MVEEPPARCGLLHQVIVTCLCVKSCCLKVCVCGGKGLSCFEAADSRFIAGRMTKVVRVTGLQVKGLVGVDDLVGGALE
jgi:hypothetical protein